MRYYLHYIFLGFQFKYIWTNCIFSPPEIAQQRGFGAYVWVSLVYRSNRQNLGSTCVFSHSLKVTPHLFSDTELRGAITKKKEKISEYVPIRLPLPLSNPDYFQFQTFLKWVAPLPPPLPTPSGQIQTFLNLRTNLWRNNPLERRLHRQKGIYTLKIFKWSLFIFFFSIGDCVWISKLRRSLRKTKLWQLVSLLNHCLHNCYESPPALGSRLILWS